MLIYIFFLIIGLCFLIPAVSLQILNPSAELQIPIEITTKEAKAEIELHPLPLEAETSRCSK